MEPLLFLCNAKTLFDDRSSIVNPCFLLEGGVSKDFIYVKGKRFTKLNRNSHLLSEEHVNLTVKMLSLWVFITGIRILVASKPSELKLMPDRGNQARGPRATRYLVISVNISNVGVL